METWKPIPGATRYEASSLGAVRSLRGSAPRVMSPARNSDGYLRLALTTDEGKRRQAFVHRLVAEAFHGLGEPDQQIRHLDGTRDNNAPDNICWGTKSENERDKVRMGTNPHANKTHCPRGHPYDEENTYLSKKGRGCRACGRAATAAYNAANRDAVRIRRRARRLARQAQELAS